jgi:hypothetical protein
MEYIESTGRAHSDLLPGEPEPPSKPIDFGIHAARTALLNAIGTPANENGLGLITDALTSCIKAASHKWPDEQFNYWLNVAIKIAKDVQVRPDQAALFQQPGKCDDTYLALIKMRGQLGDSRELDAVLGRAICVYACSRHALKPIV